MTLAPLSPPQQASVDALVRARRLRVVNPDGAKAARFLAIADERVADLPAMRSQVLRHDTAYDAAHDIGEAFLAAYGYATVNGPGQHAVIGDFLIIVVDAPPEAVRAAKGFDQTRRNRNQSHYDAVPIGAAQAAGAVRLARDLRAAAARRGVGT